MTRYLIITEDSDGNLISTCIAGANDKATVDQYVSDNNITGVVVADNSLPHHLDACSISQGSVVRSTAKEDALKMAEIRRERDAKLKETDWWAVGDRTMSTEETNYRQALRDMPSSTAATNATIDERKQLTITWPTKPGS